MKVTINDGLKEYILCLACNEVTTLAMHLKRAILSYECDERINWIFQELKEAMEKEQQIKECLGVKE